MSTISNLYSSRDTIYQKKNSRSSARGKNGDVKHIIFKDGEPVKTELIRVSSREEEPSPQHKSSGRRRIKAGSKNPTSKRSRQDASEKKRVKLAQRLKTAIRDSQTLWSEKDGIWVSYQGSQGFLVKQFTPTNRLLEQRMMTTEEILASSIPGIFDTSWKKM